MISLLLLSGGGGIFLARSLSKKLYFFENNDLKLGNMDA
jgi:hypothetical protein